ncbi:MAG: peptide chain release factor N(5)-glutamine methyltransferase [Planctomycetota bacterium]|jgi:release factor glutamine methyltransferase
MTPPATMSGTSTTQSEPWTIQRLLQWTSEYFKKCGSTSPRLDAEVLLADACGYQRIDLYAKFNEEPTEEIKSKFRELVRRRAAHEPVAYLVGKKEFYSLPFQVDASCLIPRGETEHVVIEAIDRIRKLEPTAMPQIADVCTGSGCIAVAVAKHAPNCRVIAIDVSPAALQVAQRNVALHAVQDRVQLVHGDLIASLPDQSLDFVLSNPPYVSDAEFDALDRTVREHEPRIALVAGPTGREIIDPLIQQSAAKLKDDGWLICELSPMIAQAVHDTLVADHRWTRVGLVRDLAGKQRVIVAQRSSRTTSNS